MVPPVPDTGDQVVDTAVHLLPDLGPRRRVVRFRILPVVVLVGEEGVVIVRHDFARLAVVALGVIGRQVPVHQHEVDAHRPQTVEFFFRGLLSNHHGASKILEDRHHGQTHRGVSRRVLHHHVTGVQPALGHRLFHHVARDPIFDAAHGVEKLDLGEDLTLEVVDGRAQPHQRCPADGLGDAVVDAEIVLHRCGL